MRQRFGVLSARNNLPGNASGLADSDVDVSCACSTQQRVVGKLTYFYVLVTCPLARVALTLV